MSDAQPASWEIFVSSTIADLKPDRRAVQQILRDKAEVAVYLSEDWTGGWDATVQKCRERVVRSNGFFLILGFWYGSLPPGGQKSITEMEFEWAVSKWAQLTTPPLAVMMPEVGSPAEKKLEKNARDLVGKLKEPDRSLHDGRLEAFHAAAKNPSDKWRTVRTFKDRTDLREYALANCLIWKGRTFEGAANGSVSVGDPVAALTQVSDQQLGLLGRATQLEAARGILSKLASLEAEPAICLLISGNEDGEHRLFLQNLVRIQAFRKARPSRIGRPPQSQYDLSVLTSWAVGSLLVTDAAAITDPRELAQAAATELKKQPLCLLLDQAHRLAGGVNSFQSQFWMPFQQRLRELRAEQPFDHRITAVVVEYTGDVGNWSGAVTPVDLALQAEEFSKLVLLPLLSSIVRSDVFRWCDDVEAPDDDDFRSQLANRILHDAHGKLDGAASRVYRRLRSEIVWPDRKDR